MILFNINHLFVHNEVILSNAHTNCFICMQLNGSKYCYSTTILFIYLNTVKSLLCNNNNSIFCHSSMVSSIPIKYEELFYLLIISLHTLKWLPILLEIFPELAFNCN